jgi:two-component sensor histidine kinase
VCGTAQSALGNMINIMIERASGTLSNDVAMPLALILNELLTNAAKHGTSENGSAVIRVGLADEGDNAYQLWVHDSGPGFELSKAKRKRASGLGLVDGLARQLGGSLTVEQADGARCVVRFRQRGQHQNARDSRTSLHP